MYKQFFGIRNKMRFDNEREYYETLGFLAKSDGSTSIYWEPNTNQGAWGNEGRINCYSNIQNFPAPLQRKFTAGVSSTVIHRINCNEFVLNLATNYGFVLGSNQNSAVIRNNIPPAFQADFDRGLNL
jgi:hypothetical protein